MGVWGPPLALSRCSARIALMHSCVLVRRRELHILLLYHLDSAPSPNGFVFYIQISTKRRTQESWREWFLILFYLFIYLFIYFLFFIFYFWPHSTACGISVPWPGIEPRPQQWKHWILTTRPPGNSHAFLFLIVNFYYKTTTTSVKKGWGAEKMEEWERHHQYINANQDLSFLQNNRAFITHNNFCVIFKDRYCLVYFCIY